MPYLGDVAELRKMVELVRLDTELLAATTASLEAAHAAVDGRVTVGPGWFAYNATVRALQVSVAMGLARLFDENKGVASLPRVAHRFGMPGMADRILTRNGSEIPRCRAAVERVLSFRELVRALPDRGAEVQRIRDFRDMRLAHHLVEPRPSITAAAADQFRVDVERLYEVVRVVAPAAFDAFGSFPYALEVVEKMATEQAQELWSLAVPPEPQT